jgi:hypothetical protein
MISYKMKLCIYDKINLNVYSVCLHLHKFHRTLRLAYRCYNHVFDLGGQQWQTLWVFLAACYMNC